MQGIVGRYADEHGTRAEHYGRQLVAIEADDGYGNGIARGNGKKHPYDVARAAEHDPQDDGNEHNAERAGYEAVGADAVGVGLRFAFVAFNFPFIEFV